jgi:hypothetical protein
MKKFYFVQVLLILNFLFSITSISSAESLELLRASIGIEIHSKGQSLKAKANDRLTLGDKLSIYVVPGQESFVYIINSNSKIASLIDIGNNQKKVLAHSLRVYPSPSEGYRIDGSENVESFSIICSPKELTSISQLFSGGSVGVGKWQSLEKIFIDDNQIISSSQPEEPFHFGGSLRSFDTNPFINTLNISSGKTLVIKRYHFDVKK